MEPEVGSIIMEDPSLGAPLCVVLCGAIYEGTQITAAGWPNVILFRDPTSSTVLAMAETYVTIASVWRTLEQARKDYP